jgi:hypothetical protein
MSSAPSYTETNWMHTFDLYFCHTRLWPEIPSRSIAVLGAAPLSILSYAMCLSALASSDDTREEVIELADLSNCSSTQLDACFAMHGVFRSKIRVYIHPYANVC